MKEDLKILAFTNGTASHVWRFDPLARRFNDKTKHEMFITKHEAWNDETVGANIIVLEMLTGHHIVDTCHNLGAKVVYEADDAVIDTYGKERKNLQHIGQDFRSNAIKTIRKCDAITVTNEKLAENYRRFTDKPIYVLPILMDYNYYGDAVKIKQPERNTDEIRIGWFGSKGHFEDLKMILPALNKVLDKHKNVKFVYAGYGGIESDKPSQIAVWGEDKVFGEIPRERREFSPGVVESYWPHKHRMMSFDIGISPLIDDEFNKHKEGTKWLEYSALGTPSVCSPTVYGNYIQHGKTGFLAKDNDEWEKYLNKLVEDAKLRKEMGKEAAKDVRDNWNIENSWRDWEKMYLEVLHGKIKK